MRVFLCLCGMLMAAALHAQQQPPAPDASGAAQPYTLQTGAKIVLVPGTVSLRGQIIYGLKAKDFRITDNGAEQPVTLDEDADQLGLSLVVAVQCSRMAVMEYDKLGGLPDLIESLAGGGKREIALVRFGGHPELIQPFTRSMAKISDAMQRMGPCEDGNNATRDAVSYASSILENRDNRNRHAVLLIGEERDHGSTVKEGDLIAQLGRSNTVVDAVAYSPGRNELRDEAVHFRGGSGPIGLLLMAIQAMKKNTAKWVAVQSGGDFYDFHNRNGFDESLQKLTNRVHNYYLLSFPVPKGAEEGLHEIKVSVPLYPNADIRARRNYYAGNATPPDVDK